MSLPDIGVDIVGPNASIIDIETFKMDGIQIKPDGYWVSWRDKSRAPDIQDYLNNNKEANKQIFNAMNIIKRFEPIAGKNITLRQLKTFIEIGRLFETNKERKEFEKSILQMQAAETDRLKRLEQIEDEIKNIKAQLLELQSKSSNLREEDKVVKHLFYEEL